MTYLGAAEFADRAKTYAIHARTNAEDDALTYLAQSLELLATAVAELARAAHRAD